MSLQTFFLKSQTIADESEELFPLLLDADDFKHFQVLRLKPGEKISVVDASSDYFVCEIHSVNKEQIIVSVSEKETSYLESNQVDTSTEITLFQGMPKADKLETIIRQCSEVGVDAFIPFISSRSISRPDKEKSIKKVDRLQAIAKSAAMQSGRRAIPQVNPVVSFKEALTLLQDFDYLIIFWEESVAEDSLINVIQDYLSNCLVANTSKKYKIAIIVGPEGGLSDDEIKLLKDNATKFSICSLGQTILRTETAAVSGCFLVRYLIDNLIFGKRLSK